MGISRKLVSVLLACVLSIAWVPAMAFGVSDDLGGATGSSVGSDQSGELGSDEADGLVAQPEGQNELGPQSNEAGDGSELAPASTGSLETQSVNDMATFTYSYTGESVDMRVGDGGENMTDLPQGSFEGYSTTYYSAENKVVFHFSVLFIDQMTSLTINGVDYSSYIPDTKQEKLDAFTYQHTEFDVTVSRSNTYEIATSTVRDDDPAVGNFLWSYRDEDKGNDDYIDRGKIEFVSVVYGGVTYGADDLSEGSIMDWRESAEGDGGAVFPAGAVLTVKLIPDHGMQLVSFGPNGQTFTAGDDPAVYTFEVAKGNFHLAAHFDEVDDAVVSDDDAISGGSIVLSDKDVDSGSAILSVDSAKVSDDELNALQTAATGAGEYTVQSVVDLSLNQVIYKGVNDASTAWTASLGSDEPLEENAVVSLKLADGDQYGSVVVVHQEHDGTCVAVPTQYDSATQTATFETDGFSNYAIATTKAEVKSAAVYRLYNPNSGEHFFTMSESEYENVKAAGWNDEGVAWQAPLEGAEVYRLYNPNGGDHHFTMSVEERDMLKKLGWNDEGVAFCSADESGVPVHRLYNPNGLAGNHMFTASQDESDFVKAAGWNYEGIGWYAANPEGALD
ncbi:hypothetical protein [Denitrobacterium detoxificans]|uniref:DUF5648 domain-containing protein n=1 Tax=Denitrobacterium detoxificans TaxID=79604 RepID=A0A1H8QDW4_9ACTN|nr:hypothetical protein [Denitrobacterium detoxificans]SEO52425.1 hypothetical protein SAMN02910314_00447 [Denitrobacterium detoxificans]